MKFPVEGLFEHLKEQVEIQRQVRNCEIGGSCWDIEKHLNVFRSWSMITEAQYLELKLILKNKN